MMRRAGFGIHHSRFAVRTLGRGLVLAVLVLLSGPWRLSPAFGQLPAGTPTYDVNAKWVTDHGSQVYNIKAYGAYGDDTHDDTAAIQSVYNLFCTNLKPNGVVGRVYWPAGTYKISAHIVTCGTVITEGAASAQGTGTTIDWQGPAGDTPFIMYAAYKSAVYWLGIGATSGNANFGLQIVADNAINTTATTTVAPGSVTVTPASMSSIGVGTLLGIEVGQPDAEVTYVTAATATTFTAPFTKAHSGTWTIGGGAISAQDTLDHVSVSTGGTTMSGIALGNVLGTAGGTPASSETSELTLNDISVAGAGTGNAGANGIIQLDTSNTGDMYMSHLHISGNIPVGLNMNECSFTNIISGANFEHDMTADMEIGSLCNLNATAVYSEPGSSSTQFVVGPSGSTFMSLVLTNSTFTGSGTGVNTIVWPGQMTLIGNQLNTGGGAAQIQIPYSPTIGSNRPTITSIGNYYGGASNWAPFVDSSGTALLPTYSTNYNPVQISSTADWGGTVSSRTPLSNYALVGAMTDSAMGANKVAGSGVLRGGDTSCLLGFRNHAGSADLTVCKNTSDQILASTPLGGTQLISTNTSGPPIQVASTAAVPNLTVQACNTCAISGSMSLNGGTPITGMATFQTANIAPTAVSATSCSDQTFTVSGLALASVLSGVIPPAGLGNISLNAYASAANTVLFHFCNATASAVTPPGGIYSFLATQPQRYSHVQGALGSLANGWANSPLSLTLTNNPAQGDLVVVAFTFFGCGSAPSPSGLAVADGNSNSYTISSTTATVSASVSAGVCTGSTAYNKVWLAYLLSAPSNASKTINVSWSSGQAMGSVWADEFYPLGGGASYDTVAATSSGTASGTTINLPSITPSQVGELLYSYAAVPQGDYSNSCYVNAPAANANIGVWTGGSGGLANSGSYPAGGNAEYDLSANSATAVNYTVGCSGGPYAALVAAFK